MSNVKTFLKSFHRILRAMLPTYTILSLTWGNWPRFVTKIIDLLPNGTHFFSIKASRKRESICMNNIGPMKLISYMKIHLTYHISSSNTKSAWPCKGLHSLIGILRDEWIVLARILKEATLLGYSNSKGDLPLAECKINSSEIQCIRWDFRVTVVL